MIEELEEQSINCTEGHVFIDRGDFQWNKLTFKFFGMEEVVNIYRSFKQLLWFDGRRSKKWKSRINGTGWYEFIDREDFRLNKLILNFFCMEEVITYMCGSCKQLLPFDGKRSKERKSRINGTEKHVFNDRGDFRLKKWKLNFFHMEEVVIYICSSPKIIIAIWWKTIKKM